MKNTVQSIFPHEPVYHDGERHDVHLEQRLHDWCAVCPSLDLRASRDGPNQAYRALLEALKETDK